MLKLLRPKTKPRRASSRLNSFKFLSSGAEEDAAGVRAARTRFAALPTPAHPTNPTNPSSPEDREGPASPERGRWPRMACPIAVSGKLCSRLVSLSRELGHICGLQWPSVGGLPGPFPPVQGQGCERERKWILLWTKEKGPTEI